MQVDHEETSLQDAYLI